MWRIPWSLAAGGNAWIRVMSTLSAVYEPLSPARPVRPSSSVTEKESLAAGERARKRDDPVRDTVIISARGRRILAREEAARGRNETPAAYHEERRMRNLLDSRRLRPRVPPERSPLEEARDRVTPRLQPPAPRDLRPAVPPQR